MSRPVRRRLLYSALGVLYLLHNDLWAWNDARPALGLPPVLAYHLGFCVAASGVLTLLVFQAWPEGLETGDPDPSHPSDAGAPPEAPR